ncbi:MAG: mechanosensitive ion channel family protein [Thioalkalivibrionaceae bacterium]
MDWNLAAASTFLLEVAAPWTIRIAGAIAILGIGWWLIRVVLRLARRAAERAKLDPMLIGFFASIAQVLLMLSVAIAALNHLGVYTTSLVAVLGAAGLAIALALQGSLGNLAAGVMLIVFRPFRVGDFIEAAGVLGTVEEIRIFQTRLRTPDNREVIVPNSRISDGAITNFTVRPTRRIDMIFALDIDTDVERARAIIARALEQEPRILPEPEPVIVVDEVTESQIRIAVRPWVALSDFLMTRGALYESILKGLRDAGLSLARPGRTVFLRSENAPMEMPTDDPTTGSLSSKQDTR